MRVVCIDNKPRPYSAHPELLQLIQEGEVYEVSGQSMGQRADGVVGPIYYLVGINERPRGLAADRFAPLSDLDETTLVNEEWEQKVCVPVNS